MSQHDKFMQRCLDIASNGLGTTYPNPLVGSVIVGENGDILGEGFHYKSGQPHAEVNAIKDAEQRGWNDSAFAKATLYVNLEPCSHHGKTPPCADLIVRKGFNKVVVGTLDPHKKVAGRGVQLLRDSNIEVITDVLVEECNQLNKRFFTYHKNHRPFIVLKWAQTADGFIAPVKRDKREPVWITNKYSRQLVHKLRAQEQSILVGTNTLVADNPSLTVRDWSGINPTRIVLDAKGNLDVHSNIYNKEAPTINIDPSNGFENIIKSLYEHQLQSVIIEGGRKTLDLFIENDCWDEIHQFMGAKIYFKEGISAPIIPKNAIMKSRQLIKDDVYKIFSRS
ncbi:bifunctional diaminohydroxyphosphoribosylaminopyrimidine deaminase/5-amino-6-(5-phosphoribosylamino)uracil reductase RibD [Nonlabens ponticola]|uniref:Riboflavin biosynthesis protein RibD n=2 Tax=Nonlabens ponticola TaxID=2496866 RepID=A0A3S9N0Y8_9FLAO|nr:bifunctional diaminohydroxyphosphoribosylaminopyrimidine deaminase/5-amino-6-(5-phosphoribosylamino)uracil reductase RibD [Nonlabens ponticola]